MVIQEKAAVASAAANGKHGHTLISDAKFRQLYGLALRLRLTTVLTGHEAALAGIAADLRPGDLLIAKNGKDVRQATGGHLPGGVMPAHGEAQPGERIVEAVAGAAANRLKGNGRVSVVFLPGDSAGPMLEEAHALADRAKLPVLFVEDEDGRRTKAHNGAQGKARLCEMPSIPVDAQDVVAMYRVAHESIARAREGGGPTRIVCVASDGDGVGSGDALEHLERWLLARGLPAQEWRRHIVAAWEKEN